MMRQSDSASVPSLAMMTVAFVFGSLVRSFLTVALLYLSGGIH